MPKAPHQHVNVQSLGAYIEPRYDDIYLVHHSDSKRQRANTEAHTMEHVAHFQVSQQRWEDIMLHIRKQACV